MRNLLTRVPLYLYVTILFFLIQIPLSFRNGLSQDEGTYITAGIRLITTLSREQWGHWFSGSPYIAPVLYGAGYILGDELGARLVAAFFISIAIFFVCRATDIYYGRGVANGTSLFLATNANIILRIDGARSR